MDPLIVEYFKRQQEENQAATDAGAEDQRLKRIAALTNLGESLGSAISQRQATGAAGKAIEGLAGNLANLKATSGVQEGESDVRTKNLGERQKANTIDPTSSENQAFRAIISKRFPEIAQLPDFDQLTVESPTLSKLLSPNEDLARARLDASNRRTDIMEKLGGARLGQRERGLKIQESRFEAPEEQTMASQAGKTKVLASGLNQLADKYKDNFDAMPNAQVYELATGVARMLGGGVAAQETIKHLVPASYRGNLALFMSKLTNEPQGAGQGAFVKNLVDLVKREEGNADNIISGIKQRRTGGGSQPQLPSQDAIEQELRRRGLK